MSEQRANNTYRDLFVGVDARVPLLGGGTRTYVSLDNAASTPSLKSVQVAVDNFLPYYSSVHRGTGFKSQISTHLFEEARHSVLSFVGANSTEYTCIFGKNTTEAINKLARRFPFTKERNVVLTSMMEHHSNELPWRGIARTIHINVTGDGWLDLDDFNRKLDQYKDELALVAVTGAANVTGYINPIHDLAEKVHAVGGQILVDAAQLAPHRQVDTRRLDDPAHLDYVTISAHKMYAPFGTGALVGRLDTFERGDPEYPGGGTVKIVTVDAVVWADSPERDEAGSPNTIGAVALMAAIQELERIGMDAVSQHEIELTQYALCRLPEVPGLRIYGDINPDNCDQRVGAIPFELNGVSHFKVAAILGYELGIGVRSGCFCAHPYVLHLLALSPEESAEHQSRIVAGDKSDMPGLTRASLGLYNDQADIDALIDALQKISLGEYQGTYIQDRASGEYIPEGWAPDFEAYLGGD